MESVCEALPRVQSNTALAACTAAASNLLCVSRSSEARCARLTLRRYDAFLEPLPRRPLVALPVALFGDAPSSRTITLAQLTIFKPAQMDIPRISTEDKGSERVCCFVMIRLPTLRVSSERSDPTIGRAFFPRGTFNGEVADFTPRSRPVLIGRGDFGPPRSSFL